MLGSELAKAAGVSGNALLCGKQQARDSPATAAARTCCCDRRSVTTIVLPHCHTTSWGDTKAAAAGARPQAHLRGREQRAAARCAARSDGAQHRTSCAAAPEGHCCQVDRSPTPLGTHLASSAAMARRGPGQSLFVHGSRAPCWVVGHQSLPQSDHTNILAAATPLVALAPTCAVIWRSRTAPSSRPPPDSHGGRGFCRRGLTVAAVALGPGVPRCAPPIAADLARAVLIAASRQPQATWTSSPPPSPQRRPRCRACLCSAAACRAHQARAARDLPRRP